MRSRCATGKCLTMAVLGLVLLTGPAMAADRTQLTTQDQTHLATQDQIHLQQQLLQQDMVTVRGRDLISRQEQLEFRQRLQAAATEEERNRIMNEHRELVRDRAREMGVSLPWEQPAAAQPGSGLGQGMGQGQGGGMGNGMGGGMGGGMGRGGSGQGSGSGGSGGGKGR